MGQPTKFVSLTEKEWDQLEQVESQHQLLTLMIEIMNRNIAESKATSRCRQLQDSQLLAVASKNTLH